MAPCVVLRITLCFGVVVVVVMMAVAVGGGGVGGGSSPPLVVGDDKESEACGQQEKYWCMRSNFFCFVSLSSSFIGELLGEIWQTG